MNRAAAIGLAAACWVFVLLSGCRKAEAPDMAPTTIDQAIQAGTVQAQAVADDDSASSATISLTLAGGATGTVTVTIPSGTVLYGAEAGGQRLITAVPVTIVLSAANPTVSQQVATFCMDEFAGTPSAQTVLAFSSTGATETATTQETEPLHKLDDCMAQTSLSQGDKQIAVWAVSGGMLQRSPADALQTLTDNIAEQMSAERRKSLAAKRQVANQRFTALSSADLDRIEETEFQQGLPQLRALAASTAKRQLDDLLRDDKDMLASCGYPTDSTPLFA